MDFFILSIFSPNNKMDFCLSSDGEDIAVSLTHSARADGTYLLLLTLLLLAHVVFRSLQPLQQGLRWLVPVGDRARPSTPGCLSCCSSSRSSWVRWRPGGHRPLRRHSSRSLLRPRDLLCPSLSGPTHAFSWGPRWTRCHSPPASLTGLMS